jgi:hypothetical protein
MSMRERMAKVLCEALYDAGYDLNDAQESGILDAILNELMDPDDAMIDAAKRAFIGGHPAQDISVSLSRSFVAAVLAAKEGK